jgi:hypothetical protein
MAFPTLRFSLVAAATAALSAGAALAQVSDANVRAVNMARNWAVNNNGGLSVYRPAACMFNTSDGGGSCLIQNNSQGFTFQFMGGQPGWQAEGMAPTTETEVQVSPDGRTITNVIYNGAPR